jgi:hypothetical protein
MRIFFPDLFAVSGQFWYKVRPDGCRFRGIWRLPGLPARAGSFDSEGFQLPKSVTTWGRSAASGSTPETKECGKLQGNVIRAGRAAQAKRPYFWQ